VQMLVKRYRARKKLVRYVIGVLKGYSKHKSAIEAGYSMTTAHNPSLIERTNTYSVVVKEILDTSALTLQAISNNIFKGIESGDLEGLDLATKAQILQRLTDSHVKLTPKVTVKQEETGLDGVKRTLWSEKQA
jgi:hypothetical protein